MSETAKRGRGRPKGSKNKTSTECNLENTESLTGKGKTKILSGRIAKKKNEKKTSTECVSESTECSSEKTEEIKKEMLIDGKVVKLNKDGSVPKKRGRPKKVITECSEGEVKGRRGRPSRKDALNAKIEVSPTAKKLSFLGYCKSCHGMICINDLNNDPESYTCYKCGKSAKVTELCDQLEKDNRVKSKKAFLEETITAHEGLDYDDVPMEFKEFATTIESWE